MQPTTLRSIDLFAGIGGIRLGFDRAFGENVKTVFVSEMDEYAQKTYRANFDQDDFEISGDITKIDEKDVPAFDICLAGFPCQAFSMAGKRMGFKDDFKGMARGTLFQDVVRICEEQDKDNIKITYEQAVHLLFSPLSPERELLSGQCPLIENWFPLPLYIEENDCI